MTSYERTGWRAEDISRRHRTWGFHCPAVDIDFLMLEYDHGKAVSIVEYKHHLARLQPGPSLHAIGDLYNRQGQQLPFFVACYWPDIWAFRLFAANTRASELVGREPMDLTEIDFVRGLYRLRNRAIPPDLLVELNVTMPPDEVAHA